MFMYVQNVTAADVSPIAISFPALAVIAREITYNMMTPPVLAFVS
jgi:hypothetical protein